MNVPRASVFVVLIVVGLFPATASAQKDRFVDALVGFRTALGGTYGDEGPQIEAALDAMASSLDSWDRETATAETELRSGLSEAPPEDQLRRRIALASLMLDRNRWREALDHLDAAIAADPGGAPVYLARGLVREIAGDTEAAASDFERAWELDRGDPATAYLLVTRGLATGTLDDPGPAIDALVAAQRTATRESAPAFMEVGLLRDRAEWPVLPPAAYLEGFRRIAEGRYSEAVDSFRDAVARDPLLADPAVRTEPMARGIASLRGGQFAAAALDFELAATASPESSEVRRLLGLALYLDGRQLESQEQLRAAIRVAPSDERARIGLARELLTQDRLEEAEQVLREAVAALPDSAEARWALAQMYVQSDRDAEAIAELQAVLAFPVLAGRGQLDWLLAGLYSRIRDFEANLRFLAERVRLDLNNPVVHKEIGLAYLKIGSRPQALAELLVTAFFAPDDVETLARIGQIHLDDERYADAEAVLRQVVARAPDLDQSRFALGTALIRQGRTEEGREELLVFQRLSAAKRRAEARKVELETLLHSAEQAVGEGRLDEAIASLEQAASLDDGEPRVYEVLASVYEKQGRPDDRASALAIRDRLAAERPAEPEP